MKRLALPAALLLAACQRDAAPLPGAVHWASARAALEANKPAEAYAASQTAALFDAAGARAVDAMLARAYAVADGALPADALERAAAGYQVSLLLERPALGAGERATLLTARARLALARGERAAARVDLDAARREAPQHTLSARVLGVLALEERRDAEALALLEKVVQAGDAGLEAHRGYATALSRASTPEVTAQFLAGATELHPGDGELSLAFADALERLGRPDAAMAHLERRTPRDAATARRLGQLYLDAGRLDDAERALREALAHGPDAEVSVALARVDLARGQPARARAAVEQLLATLPARPRALFDAAVVLARTGDEATARALAAQFGHLALGDASQSGRAQQLAALLKPPGRP